MRLDKFLVGEGIGSRREIKQYVKDSRVTVNNVLAKKSEMQVDPEKDQILFDGNAIAYEPFVYLIMNKRAGILSATRDNHQPTIIDEIDEYQHLNLFPVGRLDKDTTGLLLVTNDGQWAHNLMSPRKTIEKEYRAICEGTIDAKFIDAVEKGLRLNDEEVSLPGRLKIGPYNVSADTTEIHLTIIEGKYHQVKRMVHAMGSEVLQLHRMRIHNLTLPDDLASGSYRKLTSAEIEQLV